LLETKRSFLRAQVAFLSYSEGFRGGGNDNDGKQQDGLPRIRSDNPFEVLGVSKTSTYAEVKQKFLELALKHHPDHASEGESKRPDDFIRFRQAFESLKEDMDGNATRLEEGESSWTDEEFEAWYYEETGSSEFMFKIDMKTRREVIDVYNKSAQSGLDRGGIWEWARKMAEEDAIMKENKNKIKRTVGLENRRDSAKSVTRRRRKR
jgi:DnaJ-class molecular chaperone